MLSARVAARLPPPTRGLPWDATPAQRKAAREESFGLLIAIGRCTREELDAHAKRVDESAKWWEANRPKYTESELDRAETASESSSWDDTTRCDDTPLTPPESPRGDGPDLSRKRWRADYWRLIKEGHIFPDDIGFNNFERWKEFVLSEYQSRTQNSVPALSPESLPSEQLERRKAVPKPISKRTTRSETNKNSLFYELCEDGKTGRPQARQSSERRVSTRAPSKTKPSQDAKWSPYRVHKRR